MSSISNSNGQVQENFTVPPPPAVTISAGYLVHLPSLNFYMGRDGAIPENRQDSAFWLDRVSAEMLAQQVNGVVMDMRPSTLSPALAYIGQFNQFIVWKAVPDPGKKPRKVPSDYRTGTVAVNAHDPAYWTDYATAQATAAAWGSDWGVGFVLTREARVAVIDYDDALQPDGTWHPTVGEIYSKIPGAAIEISVSRKGAHNYCVYQGELPAQDITTVNIGGLKVELFLANKFIALGNQETAKGDAGTDYTATLVALVAQYFPPSKGATDSTMDWTEESYPGAIAATIDDDELLRRARRSHSPNARFSGKASVEDLWSANELALGKSYPDAGGRAYDASSADSGIAHHFAWWTGGNCAQIERLMRRADCGLVRDKWDRRGTYLRDTILKAVANTEGFYGDKTAAVAGATGTGAKGAVTVLPGALTVPSGTPDELTPEDFWAILPTHSYINTRTGEFHGVDAVNAHLKRFTEGSCQGFKPAAWLDMFRVCHQMSWQPAEPQIIEGMVSKDGYLEPDPKGRIYNLYRPSKAVPTEDDASPWLNHVRALFPGDAEHIFKWFAFRVQYPGTKINHALVIGGAQGIGKDLMLEPLRYGVGIGNFADLNPSDLFKDFTKWVESTLVVINEARDLGDVDRYKFYDNCKRFIAAPPDNLPCNKKGIESYSVPNVMAVVITSNNKLSGLYIDPDDRRHYVAWSAAEKESPAYFESLWNWMLEGGGKQAVLGYLQRYNLAGWDPKAPPTKTEAWYQMVAAHANPEESALGDALEGIMLATFQEIIVKLQLGGHMDLLAIFQDRKNAKKAARLLECAGLEYLPNPGAKGDRRWSLNGKRETLYASRALPLAERLRLANGRTVGQ
jgi:hypothetical protein